MPDHFKAFQGIGLIPPNARLLPGNIYLLLYGIYALQVGEKQPAFVPIAYDDPIPDHIQLAYIVHRLRLPKDIHAVNYIIKLIFLYRVEPGVLCPRTDGILDDLIGDTGTGGAYGSYASPELAIFFKRYEYSGLFLNHLAGKPVGFGYCFPRADICFQGLPCQGHVGILVVPDLLHLLSQGTLLPAYKVAVGIGLP